MWIRQSATIFVEYHFLNNMNIMAGKNILIYFPVLLLISKISALWGPHEDHKMFMLEGEGSLELRKSILLWDGQGMREKWEMGGQYPIACMPKFEVLHLKLFQCQYYILGVT